MISFNKCLPKFLNIKILYLLLVIFNLVIAKFSVSFAFISVTSSEDLISLTEKGALSGPEASVDEADSPQKVTPGTSPSVSPIHDDQQPSTSAAPTPTSANPKGYSNTAYRKDVSFDSMSNVSSEKPLSAYGDAASMTLGDDPEVGNL